MNPSPTWTPGSGFGLDLKFSSMPSSQPSILHLSPVLMPKLSTPTFFCFSRGLADQKSGSLADSIMNAKLAEDKKDSKEKKEEEDPGPRKPKPLTKWQKYGYWTFGILFGGSIIANAILFCKNGWGFDVRGFFDFSTIFFFFQLFRTRMRKGSTSRTSTATSRSPPSTIKGSRTKCSRPRRRWRILSATSCCRIPSKNLIINQSTRFSSNSRVYWFIPTGR